MKHHTFDLLTISSLNTLISDLSAKYSAVTTTEVLTSLELHGEILKRLSSKLDKQTTLDSDVKSTLSSVVFRALPFIQTGNPAEAEIHCESLIELFKFYQHAIAEGILKPPKIQNHEDMLFVLFRFGQRIQFLGLNSANMFSWFVKSVSALSKRLLSELSCVKKDSTDPMSDQSSCVLCAEILLTVFEDHVISQSPYNVESATSLLRTELTEKHMGHCSAQNGITDLYVAILSMVEEFVAKNIATFSSPILNARFMEFIRFRYIHVAISAWTEFHDYMLNYVQSLSDGDYARWAMNDGSKPADVNHFNSIFRKKAINLSLLPEFEIEIELQSIEVRSYDKLAMLWGLKSALVTTEAM